MAEYDGRNSKENHRGFASYELAKAFFIHRVTAIAGDLLMHDPSLLEQATVTHVFTDFYGGSVTLGKL